MTNHTLGPWHANEPDEFGDIAIGWNGSVLALGVAIQHGKPLNENIANARLMAAAPKMREALEEISRCVDSEKAREIAARALAAE